MLGKMLMLTDFLPSFVKFYYLSFFFLLTDPLQESDVWMEEDLESFARKFTDDSESHVYTRNLANPLGQNLSSGRKGRSSSENLGDFYPNS